MPKSRAFAADLLAWVFHGAQPSWADRAHFWVSLHSADPALAGNSQATAEATYPGYRRAPMGRGPAGMAIEGREATNLQPVEFPACTADGPAQELTHYGIGTDATGEGRLLYSLALDEALVVRRRLAPRVPVRAMTVQET
jgi:hypothetical protein